MTGTASPAATAGPREAGDARFLALLVLLGATARMALAALPRVIRWDEPDYLWLGRNLITGHGYRVASLPLDLHYPPLLPLLFAPLTLVASNLEWVGNAWYIAAGALLPWPVYALARRVFDRRVAATAALLAAVFPLLVISPLHWGTFSEPPYLLLLFAGAWQAHVALREGGTRHHALAAALLALAYLMRPEAILAVALIGLVLATRLFRQGSSRRAAAAGMAAYLLTAAVVTAPYLIYLRHETGRWMVTGKVGITLALGDGVLDRDPEEYDRSVGRLDSSGEEIVWLSHERNRLPGLAERLRSDPGAFLARVSRNLGFLAAGLLGRWWFLVPFVAAGALGAMASVRTRRQIEDQLFLALLLAPCLSFLALHIQVRFFAPAAPVVLIWVAAALERMGDLVARPRGAPGVLRRAPAALAAAALLLAWPRVLRTGRESLDFGHKAMGLWMRDHTGSGAVVLARDPAVALYAGRGFAPVPHASYEDVLCYARAHGATLWATDSDELTAVKPELSFLLDPERRPAGLTEIYSAPSEAGINYVFALPGDSLDGAMARVGG